MQTVNEYYVHGHQCGFYWNRAPRMFVAYAAGTVLGEFDESDAKDKTEKACD